MSPTETSPKRRGFALAMVLVLLAVLFIIGLTVGGLSTNNARMVSTVQDKARARQAAWAGQAAAQVRLNALTSWAATGGASPSASIVPAEEVSLPDPSNDERARAYYTLTIEGQAKAQRITVRSTGYLKGDDGARRVEAAVIVRYQRAEGAFRYPVQADGGVSIQQGAVSSVDDVAIRTNATAPNQVSANGVVQGDILVGPSESYQSVVGNKPSGVTVTPAPATADLMPVTAPTLEAGHVVVATPSPSPTSGGVR